MTGAGLANTVGEMYKMMMEWYKMMVEKRKMNIEILKMEMCRLFYTTS